MSPQPRPPQRRAPRPTRQRTTVLPGNRDLGISRRASCGAVALLMAAVGSAALEAGGRQAKPARDVVQADGATLRPKAVEDRLSLLGDCDQVIGRRTVTGQLYSCRTADGRHLFDMLIDTASGSLSFRSAERPLETPETTPRAAPAPPPQTGEEI